MAKVTNTVWGSPEDRELVCAGMLPWITKPLIPPVTQQSEAENAPRHCPGTSWSVRGEVCRVLYTTLTAEIQAQTLLPLRHTHGTPLFRPHILA